MSRARTSTALLVLALLALVPSAFSEPCGPNASTLMLENPRPFEDIDGSFTFYAYYNDAAGTPIQGENVTLTVDFQNATYNMTNLTTRWSLTVTSNVSEDVTFTVNASSPNHACKSRSFTTSFRTPFYVKFQLFKEPLNNTDPARYANDFQYVVAVNNADKNKYDMTAWAINAGTNKLINSIASIFMTDEKLDLTVPDNNVYFWGKYSSGEATLKLYEGGNYTILVMNNKVEYPINYFWEFQRPTTQDVEYMGNVYNGLRIYNETNISDTARAYNGTTFKISLSKYEANTYYFIMNIAWTILIVGLWFAGLLLVIWIAANSNNGGQVIAYYILIGGALAIGAIMYVR